MGFSENKSQVDASYWVKALMHYNAQLKKGMSNCDQLENNPVLNNRVDKNSRSHQILNNRFNNSTSDGTAIIPAKENQYQIPLDMLFPADTGKKGNSLSDSLKFINKKNTDTTKISDSLKIKKGIWESSRRGFLVVDTTKSIKDTAKVDKYKIDSTARLKYFTHQRKDYPYTTLKRQREYSFYAQPSDNLRRRTAEIDSTGEYVVIKEFIGSTQTKILLRVPIAEYIEDRMVIRNRELWESLGYDYSLKNKQELADIIKSFTDFEIPLPSLGVLSIFGKRTISLRIGGAVDITGAWRNETTEGITASALGNSRNEPSFKQQIQINVNGTIGDKLNIAADWSTERTFEYENQLKIKYTGYDDEIVQSVEAGNVSLQTGGLVGGGEALFGIKSVFKLGPFTLTALASQKKGEIKEVSVNSGSQSSTFEVRAYEYSQRHFFVDTLYSSQAKELNLFSRYYNTHPIPEQVQALKITEIEVWKSINIVGSNPNERYAKAYIDLNVLSGSKYADSLRDIKNGINIPGKSESGRFVLLSDGTDYIYHPETGFISFTSVQDQDILAVAYKTGNGDTYGEFTKNSRDSVLVLKLIKPSYLQPAYTEAWKLMLKNIYYIKSSGIKPEGFEFNIKREVESQEPVTNYNGVNLLNAFGLDIYDQSKTNANPDNLFDFTAGMTIMPNTGEVIFPTLEPFGRNFPANLPDSLKFQDIYDKDPSEVITNKVKDKWVFTGKSSGGVQSVYQLGYNIVENSVKVRLNGKELSAGVDYVMDYNTGQLNIRNDAALIAGANLSITYEQNDLFQLASKTLVGARGLYEFSDKTKLGFSILNLNNQTLNDKVRIGEEPLSNTMYGVDFSTSGDLPFLTKTLDRIFSTKEMSGFTFAGEAAYINPDPNTKKSIIPSDQGKSIAYIDDFEGSKKIIPIGISYTSWKDISPPDKLPFLSDTLSYMSKMDYKGKSFWFNSTPSDVTVLQIWGDRKKVAREDEQTTVLDYVFLPDSTGPYNYYPIKTDRKAMWGGMMKPLSSTASNLVTENIQYIEFWAKTMTDVQNPKIYIDLGRISEDVIPDGQLSTEDKDQNSVLDPAGKEDVGIDGINDEEERIKYNSTAADPSGDDFEFKNSSIHTYMDYYKINGQEGNAVLTDIGRIPDTEDLNRNGSVDKINSYYRYEVPLDTNAATNKFIAGGGIGTDPTWHLYRVPLKDFIGTVGTPRFENVSMIRLLVHGVDGSLLHLRITEFNLVGNQWEKMNSRDSAVIADTTMQVSVINFEDNPNYTSPVEGLREVDRSKPDENVLKNEQSMDLIISNLQPGDNRQAVKYLTQALNVFDYKEMKMFIHGDEHPYSSSNLLSDSAGHNSEIFFRFGSDTNNFYQYRQPIVPNWSEIDIVFKELTALKQARDSAGYLYEEGVLGKDGHFYGVKGSPSLTNIKFLLVGIINTTQERRDIPVPISGELWVNELRVIDADSHPGYAYTLATTLKMADILNLSFNMSYTDPYFHGLADRFGSKVEQRNWSVSGDLDILKIMPFNLPESNLRLVYSHTESIGKPLYVPGTDISVEEAVKELSKNNSNVTADQLRSSTQTVTTSDSYSSSNIKLKIPTNYWLIRDSFNALIFNFNYNKTYSRSPTVAFNRYWTWAASGTYGISLSPDYFIFPAKIPGVGAILNMMSDYRGTKIYFTPQSISASLNYNRSRNTSVSRDQTSGDITGENVARDFNSKRGFSINWKMTENAFWNINTAYSANFSSTLTYLELDQNNQQRKESDIIRDILAGQFFGKDNSFNQTVDIKTNPRLPSLWNINQFFSITTGYNVQYSWQNNIAAADLGRSASFNSRFNFSLNLRLKALSAPLFEEKKEVEKPIINVPVNNTNIRLRVRGERDRINLYGNIDSTKISKNISMTSDSVSTKKGTTIKTAVLFFKTITRILFFDYENISVNFAQDNGLGKSGIWAEGSGISNFWSPFFIDRRGPTRAFMFGFGSDVGKRAANGNLQDVYSQKNSMDFKTSKPLWEGAKIDLNWRISWQVNKTTSFTTDANGNSVINSKTISSTGSLSRSFLSFPPVLFLSAFKSGISRVHENYNPEAADKNANLSAAFLKGFESIPLLSKFGFLNEFAKYIPRPNWRISWDGLEKIFIFKSFTKKVSFEHAYTSSYTEGWKSTTEGANETQSQKVDYGFTPLAGLNMTFNDLWKGSLTGTVKYNTTTGYSLSASTSRIVESYSKELGISANYSKQGFEIPMFGISLKNDIDFTFSYSNNKSTDVWYDMDEYIDGGTPNQGSTRVTMEPRIRYTVSSKLSLSIFYRRTSVTPEGSSSITPTTTTEAGLEVHITIQ